MIFLSSLFRNTTVQFTLLPLLKKIAYYNQQTESIKFIELPYPINKISSLDITNHGLLTIATDNGVILFNPENKTSQLIDIRTPMQSSNEAISIYEDKEGELWIFPTTPGVIRFNPATGEKQYLFTPEKRGRELWQREQKHHI